MRSIRVMRTLQVLIRFDELLSVVCEDPSWLWEWSQEPPQTRCCPLCILAVRRITQTDTSIRHVRRERLRVIIS